jgi:hypothetical protein
LNQSWFFITGASLLSLQRTDLTVGGGADPWAIPCPAEFFAASNTRERSNRTKRRNAEPFVSLAIPFVHSAKDIRSGIESRNLPKTGCKNGKRILCKRNTIFGYNKRNYKKWRAARRNISQG